MSILDDIIAHGNRGPFTDYGRYERNGPNDITCKDGFTLSVIAGEGTYCTPRPNWPFGENPVPAEYPGPYTHVEVGFPSMRPEPWKEWLEYCEDTTRPRDTVYAYVPVDMVRALIESHGGEV